MSDPIKAIISERQGGKTAKMIFAMLANPDAVMVVHSHREQQRIIGMHPELRGRIYTFDDFAYRSIGSVFPHTPVYVDNADMLLRRHFGNVTLISFDGGVAQW